MLMEAMPELLSWSAGNSVFQQVHDAYVALMSDSLGQVIGKICRENLHLGEHLRAGVHSASDEALMRVLMAPETSHHLLWPESHTLVSTATFLSRSFRAEAARTGQRIAFQEETWTALGDVGFFPNGIVCSMPSLPEMMPLDFGSPYATKIDLSGAERPDFPVRTGFDPVEINHVLNRLRAAQEQIYATSATVAQFIVQFNKVLVLQKDPENPGQRASGSSGQYIGRSFITNPHIVAVDAAGLADAIVHEGIHALLYMQERQKRWVFNSSLCEPIARIESPWSGNPLPLRPFLQACFVWYGLLHFWCLALTCETFHPQHVHTHIMRSLQGFVKGPLLTRIARYTPDISPDLLNAIQEMQAIVTTTFASVA